MKIPSVSSCQCWVRYGSQGICVYCDNRQCLSHIFGGIELADLGFLIYKFGQAYGIVYVKLFVWYLWYYVYYFVRNLTVLVRCFGDCIRKDYMLQILLIVRNIKSYLRVKLTYTRCGSQSCIRYTLWTIWGYIDITILNNTPRLSSYVPNAQRIIPISSKRGKTKPDRNTGIAMIMWCSWHLSWSTSSSYHYHDDVIKWKHFPRNWPFVRGIHRSRWIPHTKASDVELWCFRWSASEQTVE